MIETLLLLASLSHFTPYTVDPLLMSRAQIRADQLCEVPFSHAGWVSSFEGLQRSYIGENLACAGDVNDEGICVKQRGVFEEPEDIHNAWMGSPTHAANIVNPKYARMGIAQSTCGITVQLFSN